MTATSPPAGPRRSRAADAELTREMWGLWVSGMSQPEIGRRYGIATSRVSERLARYRQALPADDRDMLLRREAAALEDMRSRVAEALTHPDPPLYSYGRPVTDAAGNSVPDFGPRLKAVEAAGRVHDRYVRLFGLAAPTQLAVEHSVDDAAAQATQEAAERAKARLEAMAAVAYVNGDVDNYKPLEGREIAIGSGDSTDLMAEVEALVSAPVARR